MFFSDVSTKKSTASSESKALLQSKVKTEATVSSKLDSTKYKLHTPSISLPSFSSKPGFLPSEPEVKEEVKTEPIEKKG